MRTNSLSTLDLHSRTFDQNHTSTFRVLTRARARGAYPHLNIGSAYDRQGPSSDIDMRYLEPMHQSRIREDL